MNSLKKHLTVKDGIALGIGSIMGSGILFLPSMTTFVAGQDVILSWIIAIVLCLPLTFIFSELVALVPNESGLQGFIEIGLGRQISSSVPIVLLGTVFIGMPSAALIAGDYAANYFGLDANWPIAIALTLVAVAMVANLGGAKLGGAFQQIIAVLFCILGAVLFAVTAKEAMPKYTSLVPVGDIPMTLSGIVLAFWAFAGFENMTFMAGEFKNPRRDITLSIVVSLILCGFLYLFLTANYAALVGMELASETTGLASLGAKSGTNRSVDFLIVFLAVGAVLINLTSWTWGISRLVYSSSQNRYLPAVFSKLNNQSIPTRSLALLWIVFSSVIVLLGTHRDYFSMGLKLVSTNFVALYLLTAISYVKVSKTKSKKILGLALGLLLLAAIFSSGILMIYPAILVLVSAGIYTFRKTPVP